MMEKLFLFRTGVLELACPVCCEECEGETCFVFFIWDLEGERCLRENRLDFDRDLRDLENLLEGDLLLAL